MLNQLPGNRAAYFDYAATTPTDPRVVAAMLPYLTDAFGNPASIHHFGWEASLAVTVARNQVAKLIGAQAGDIVWTSGATESNNLALKGIALRCTQPAHFITTRIEHKSVLDTMSWLEEMGHAVTYLRPDSNGQVDVAAFAQALQSNTVLASVMLVNNETGSVQPAAQLGALCRQNGTLFHMDAAQAAGKLAIDVHELQVDLMSLSAHKIYGPKGVGALYVNPAARERLVPLLHGGAHEGGLRSGTLPTHQIVGMGHAFALARAEWESDRERILALRDRLLAALRHRSGLKIYGAAASNVPHILNLGLPSDVRHQFEAGMADIAVSGGSACNSASGAPSHVLTALGCDEVQAGSAVRCSFGRPTTPEEIDRLAAALETAFKRAGHG